ncbi:MAG: NAD(P) transhydrogenase subunit alpha [Wenzhouxiangellaceae bacterium]|nr:NAD(P) transhydrogenase subunit alpha [Wenzhouxiangellaceae bacterium]
MALTIGVIRETAEREKRVAIDPPVAKRLLDAGLSVVVERGAGIASGHPDTSWPDVEWADSARDVAARCDVLACVQRPESEVLDAMRQGALLVGSLAPYRDLDRLGTAVENGVSMIAMELIPRISRAQSMDVLSSQATIAGYQAVLIAADRSPRMFPMLTTAAGTLRPARAVVIGAGVAGLQAIATARRLGCQVEAYDIRAAAREQVESLGAKMIDTGVDAETEGGYARDLTDEEKARQAEALSDRLSAADVVISTAAVPGRPAPKIIDSDMVEKMKPGSVLVDIAAETGGNCELTRPGECFATGGGVIVDGPLALPSRCPLHASEMYAKNVFNLLQTMVRDGELVVDREDEVVRGALLAHAGRIVHERFLEKKDEG